jgi:Flp pilus assembly protein CpaB
MEMDSSRRRRLILMTLGIVLAVVAGGIAFVLASRPAVEPGEEVQTEGVVVAAREIQPRTPLTADDVVLRQIPVDQAIPQAYRNAEQLIDLQTTVTVYEGMQITPNLLVSPEAGRDFEIIPVDEEITEDTPHWRAVSVQVPSNRAVGGEVTSGSRIDLIATVDFRELLADAEAFFALEPLFPASCNQGDAPIGVEDCFSTKIVVQDMQVLKANPEEAVYVLRADLHQAEQLYQLTKHQNDPFSIALRSDRDTRSVDPNEYGETTDSIITRYRFVVPLWLRVLRLVDFPAVIPIVPEPGQSPVIPSPSPEPAEPTEPPPSP